MKNFLIFLVFALVLICGLVHGKSVADSSSKDENNNLEDQNCPDGCDTLSERPTLIAALYGLYGFSDYVNEDQTISGSSKLTITIAIMIGVLLFILALILCPRANNYTMDVRHIVTT